MTFNEVLFGKALLFLLQREWNRLAGSRPEETYRYEREMTCNELIAEFKELGLDDYDL